MESARPGGVQRQKQIKDLLVEFNSSEWIKRKLPVLEETFSHYRKIGEEADSYYKAVAYGYLELLTNKGKKCLEAFIETINQKEGFFNLAASGFKCDIEATAGTITSGLVKIIDEVATKKRPALLLNLFKSSPAFVESIVLLMKAVVANFLLTNRALNVQGVSLESMINAEGSTIEEYISKEMLAIRKEPHPIICQIMPMALRIGIQHIVVDPLDETEKITVLEHPCEVKGFKYEANDALNFNDNTICLLSSQGHYDLIYQIPLKSRKRKEPEFSVAPTQIINEAEIIAKPESASHAESNEDKTNQIEIGGKMKKVENVIPLEEVLREEDIKQLEDAKKAKEVKKEEDVKQLEEVKKTEEMKTEEDINHLEEVKKEEDAKRLEEVKTEKEKKKEEEANKDVSVMREEEVKKEEVKIEKEVKKNVDFKKEEEIKKKEDIQIMGEKVSIVIPDKPHEDEKLSSQIEKRAICEKCNEAFLPADHIIILSKCSHKLHEKCVQVLKKCPICNQDINKADILGDIRAEEEKVPIKEIACEICKAKIGRDKGSFADFLCGHFCHSSCLAAPSYIGKQGACPKCTEELENVKSSVVSVAIESPSKPMVVSTPTLEPKSGSRQSARIPFNIICVYCKKEMGAKERLQAHTCFKKSHQKCLQQYIKKNIKGTGSDIKKCSFPECLYCKQFITASFYLDLLKRMHIKSPFKS